MDEITKALNDLAKAVERNDLVSRVSVTITLAKPKPKPKPDKGHPKNN